MKKLSALFLFAILSTGCADFTSEDLTKILKSAETLAKCAEIAHQCANDLKPTKDLDEAMPVLIACKDQLLANGCKESIESLL
jgi:hypothetical protein